MRQQMRAFLALLVGMLVVGGSARADAEPAAQWTWPVDPPHRVVRGFEPPAHDWLPGHRGVDLAAPAAARIVSAGAGTVTFAGVIAGVGVVAVRHPGGLETTYQPVHASVRRGDHVRRGQEIGTLAPGGHCARDACLHWGLRRGQDYLDPLGLVGAGRVRLLPVLSGRSTPPWTAPAAGGAGVGSSVVCLLWFVRRRRALPRMLPPGVSCLAAARERRAAHAAAAGEFAGAGRVDDG